MLILDFGAVSSAPVSPAVHRSGYAAKRFTRNADLCRSVMEICALPEVIALGHTCRDLRPVALCVAQIRFESQTRRFFPARASELPTVLYRCKAVITGSVALRMLYEPKVITSAPRDLNIVVASGGGLKKLTEWLIDNDYQLDKDFLVEDSMSPCIKSFWAYILGNRIITVSESIHSDILDVVVNSPSTADMTFMTAGGLVTLYPDITLSHRTVLTNIGKRVVQNEESMGCMSCPNIIVGETNDFLHHPCGDLCPTAWRHAGTDNALLCMDWDMRYSIQQFVKRSNADWRINSVCHNPHCGNFSRAFDTSGEAFTVRPPPSLSYDVMMRKEKIKCHVPVLLS
ncbi:hypothetical protein BJ138DRAFT_802116 [Hygrophoropsis aurantiaca]|uniref:Uncharacterized protein n=1 Tax=Hygrophoropsis aurantiaca TaxID=72124 RepID=A0ACB8AGT7_9AGAM|nr:hypothetical protein BJ138DRAFT_802116 [Hygrophoropsis aurantiaca]